MWPSKSSQYGDSRIVLQNGHLWVILVNMRTCACGCGQKPSIRYGKWQRFAIRHSPRGRGIPREEIFWTKTKKTEACWLWISTRHSQGYGKFFYRGRQVFAHRFAWKLTYGKIPAGKWVLHRPPCQNRLCVRPSHLYLGTVKENSADMILNGNSRKGEKMHNAKTTAAQVRKMRREASAGIPQAVLAKRYGLKWTTVFAIIHRRTWKHVL
jgi:hypothetical protein